ncbi:hypothetical protein Za10_0814 [Zymomonas mobilis subsp. mobilis NCIMB 11163]|uniref:Uncharacterized protein n=1 Tax=Zymomonas mobilis subsp. mobilis (strain ATCC 10988 / DSM 424 / LMG 404 / NCIMB 8938 / NRRL B-806 / ZM1) TaxID=555217 RepID=A0A0H3FYG2_ZYMMA|nr:hypothetical protein Za10_0814 [Zymomonas mobilis subsp. mobilis NCIMB 11163]AEH62802.1 conserved hypothetical protein [Zymomonas mobilis subsp. mobilis ATCC 10988]TQL27592.1 hypothetical protein FBY55_0917 [Zymomonas mobilis]TQL29534.1 hypothetical protein FBY54_0350 [Zymomonas mobilis]TWD59986.1 hypothetical protein FBY50_0795 [Zymomonas mobilis]
MTLKLQALTGVNVNDFLKRFYIIIFSVVVFEKII